MPRSIAWMLAFAFALCLSLPGCSSATKTEGPTAIAPGDLLGELPDDLVIDITVLQGRDAQPPPAAQFMQQRLIVFPDGSLRGDFGPSVSVLMRPGLTRRLTREQMADLWLIAKQAGFGDPATAPFDGNPALLAPNAGEVLTIITIRANGRPGTFLDRITPTPQSSDATATARLVRAVERLAWASDEPPADAIVLPLRYDLGPEPYSRYLPALSDPRAPGGQTPVPIIP